MSNFDLAPPEVEDYGYGTIVSSDSWYYFTVPAHGDMGALSQDVEKARLYGDVYHLVGGLSEEKNGDRDVPLSVESAGEDVVTAYMMAQPEMNAESVARRYDLSEQEVKDHVRAVRERAEEARQDDEVKKQIVEFAFAERKRRKEEQRAMEEAMFEDE